MCGHAFSPDVLCLVRGIVRWGSSQLPVGGRGGSQLPVGGLGGNALFTPPPPPTGMAMRRRPMGQMVHMPHACTRQDERKGGGGKGGLTFIVVRCAPPKLKAASPEGVNAFASRAVEGAHTYHIEHTTGLMRAQCQGQGAKCKTSPGTVSHRELHVTHQECLQYGSLATFRSLLAVVQLQGSMVV